MVLYVETLLGGASLAVCLNRTANMLATHAPFCILRSKEVGFSLHALTESPFVSYHNEVAYFTVDVFVQPYGTKVSRITSSSWICLSCRLGPQHLKNLVAINILPEASNYMKGILALPGIKNAA